MNVSFIYVIKLFRHDRIHTAECFNSTELASCKDHFFVYVEITEKLVHASVICS